MRVRARLISSGPSTLLIKKKPLTLAGKGVTAAAELSASSAAGCELRPCQPLGTDLKGQDKDIVAALPKKFNPGAMVSRLGITGICVGACVQSLRGALAGVGLFGRRRDGLSDGLFDGGRPVDALGTHLLLELRECDPGLLDDLAFIEAAMVGASREAGATILGRSFHKFTPRGVTGVIAIAESHLCIHTWPEHRYAAVDIFTCGAAFTPSRAADLIIEGLDCRDPSTTVVKRGLVSSGAAAPA